MLALVRVLVVVLVLMFVGVHVSAITIAITLGFMARHPNVGTGAGAERRTSHSTAGTAAPSKAPSVAAIKKIPAVSIKIRRDNLPGTLKPIIGHLSIVSRADPEPTATRFACRFRG